MTSKQFRKKTNHIRILMSRNKAEAARRVPFEQGQHHFFQIIETVMALLEEVLTETEKKWDS